MSFVVRKPRVVEEDELLAAAWHDAQQAGLGDDCLDEVESVVAALPVNPLLNSIRFADVRCARWRRFKNYGLFYVIRGEEIRLLAVPRTRLAACEQRDAQEEQVLRLCVFALQPD